jgi:hypothetical protein
MFKRYIYFSFILISCIGLTAAGHKFYVSITQVDINNDSRKLEISARIFSDDLETTLLSETGQKLRLGSEKEHPKADSILFSYIRTTLNIRQDGTLLDLVFIGKEVEADVTWIYLESKTGINIDKPLTISNEYLFQQFPDQKNLVNLKFGKETTSQIHTKGKAEYVYEIKK